MTLEVGASAQKLALKSGVEFRLMAPISATCARGPIAVRFHSAICNAGSYNVQD